MNGFHVQSGVRVHDWSGNGNNRSLQTKLNGTTRSVGNKLFMMLILLGVKE